MLWKFDVLRRRVLITNLMIADRAAINGGFDFRLGHEDDAGGASCLAPYTGWEAKRFSALPCHHTI
jgi:hypothetical protein